MFSMIISLKFSRIDGRDHGSNPGRYTFFFFPDVFSDFLFFSCMTTIVVIRV